MTKLSFPKGNAKLGAEIFTFSLPAGWSCPGARDCLAKVGRNGGLTDGKNTLFRCFAASAEAMYPSVRKSRWNNFDLLRGKSCDEMAQLIGESLPANANLVRVHVSGDFFNADYFRAWMRVAADRPEIIFYAYTKSVKIWIENRDFVPANFHLTASYGGTHDELIKLHGLKTAIVVFSVEQSQKLGLEIDHDDSHAYASNASFALLLHGQQPKGSKAAKALSTLKIQGHKGYSRKSAKAAKPELVAA
jgi:hypothetical protein